MPAMQYLLGDFECQKWPGSLAEHVPSVYEAAGSISSPSEENRKGQKRQGRLVQGSWSPRNSRHSHIWIFLLHEARIGAGLAALSKMFKCTQILRNAQWHP